MWCIKPTFFDNFLKSAKFAQSRILHSLKPSGVRIRTNLVVLGARDQDSGGSGGCNNKNQNIWAQNDPSEGFCHRRWQKEDEICNFLLARRELTYVYTEEVCFDRR